jgi:ribonuclease Z
MGKLKSVSRHPVASQVIALLALWACCWAVAYADHTACNQATAALQILGSSGPLNAKGSASTSYLLWWMSRPLVIVDLGPGSVANLVRADAKLTDLDMVLISHIHPDHVSDLPGLLWDEDILGRDHPLLVAGPTGNGEFPDIGSFLDRLFGAKGAFPFMHDVLDSHSKFHLDVKTIDATRRQRVPVAKLGDLAVSAYPVPHGRAPSLAYRIDASAFSVVFASDQSGTDSRFATFAEDADLLVLHTALSPTADRHPFAKVVGLPQTLGALAEAAHVKRVVLSHLMAVPNGDPRASDFSLYDLNGLVAAVRSVYHGEVSLASDLKCVELGRPSSEPR